MLTAVGSKRLHFCAVFENAASLLTTMYHNKSSDRKNGELGGPRGVAATAVAGRQRSQGFPIVQSTGMLSGQDGADIKYVPSAFNKSMSQALTEQLMNEIGWEQREVVVFGKRVLQPRLTAYQADGIHLKYKYSKVTLTPDPWHPLVLDVKEKVEAIAGCTFNSCLLNLYRNGNDSLSFHSDNEPEYGENPTIASVSFGVPRDFVLRRNANHAEKITYTLGSGDVLIMMGATQKHWMHSVPKRKSSEGPRINLTFRQVLNPSL